MLFNCFRSSSVTIALDELDPGETVEGTKCGENKVGQYFLELFLIASEIPHNQTSEFYLRVV